MPIRSHKSVHPVRRTIGGVILGIALLLFFLAWHNNRDAALSIERAVNSWIEQGRSSD